MNGLYRWRCRGMHGVHKKTFLAQEWYPPPILRSACPIFKILASQHRERRGPADGRAARAPTWRALCTSSSSASKEKGEGRVRSVGRATDRKGRSDGATPSSSIRLEIGSPSAGHAAQRTRGCGTATPRGCTSGAGIDC